MGHHLTALLLSVSAAAQDPQTAYDLLKAQAGSAGPAPASVEGRPAPDYCAASIRYGVEGFPSAWFQVDCTGGESFQTGWEWCWSQTTGKGLPAKERPCMDAVGPPLTKIMAKKGYAQVRAFKFGFVFQRAGAPPSRPGDLCLAKRTSVGTRWAEKFDQAFVIDCGTSEDGVSTLLEATARDRESNEAVSRHMQMTGHALVGSFPYPADRGPNVLLLFERRQPQGDQK